MRQFSLRAVLLVLLAVAAACTSAQQPTPTTAPTAAKPAAAPSAPATAASPTTAVASPAPSAKPATAPSPSAAPAASPAAAASPSAGPAVSITGPIADEAKSLHAAGATFPAPLYQKWFEVYANLTQVQVNFQAIGSGGGIKGIQDQTIDFGASDAPMTDQQLADAKGGPIFHIPSALGGIVATYNIPEVKTKLKFTSGTLAGIFLGDITKWNDPKLTADNPDLAQVNQDIVTVHRSDGSGTNYAFTDYLSTVSPDFKSKVGKGTSVNWPSGLGGSGNPGVAGEVQQTPYSIGYVELIYALQNNLQYAQLKNKAGQWVDASLDSVTAAASASLQTVAPDLRFSIVDAPSNDSYPISTATWLLVYKNQTDQAKATAVARLLWWATHDGQQYNKDLQYAVVPSGLTSKSEDFIRQINVNGTPALK